MRFHCILLLFLLALPFSSGNVHAAKCTGAANCKVCTDCSRCAHCKSGGSCGVCSGKKFTVPERVTTPLFRASPPTSSPPIRTPRPEPEESTPKPTSRPAVVQDGISVYFSPRGGCTDAIVEKINMAKTSVKVQAYRLTHIPIVKAIAAAHDRGVKVSLILDKMQNSEKYSDATYFHNRNMVVLIDRSHAIAHNKVIIIDEEVVITGSFNFSANAEDDNAENLLIIEGKQEIAKAYLTNFTNHEAHAIPYKGIGKAGAAADVDDNSTAQSREWMKLAELYISAKNNAKAKELLMKVITMDGEGDLGKQAKQMMKELPCCSAEETVTPANRP